MPFKLAPWLPYTLSQLRQATRMSGPHNQRAEATRDQYADRRPQALPSIVRGSPTTSGASYRPRFIATSSATEGRGRSYRDTHRLSPPSGQSFFRSSRNVEVTRSNFHTTQGHHTNLTVNLNHSAAVGHASDEESVVRAQSHLLDEPQNLLVEPFATSQEGVTLYPQAPRKSSDRYARLLASAGRGFPLWIPEAHRNLPSAYRRTGVRIGDVGIITSSGSFSFLFNIFAPIVDPIHPSPLPEEFTPLRPAPSAGDVRLIPEFRSGSYLASSSVEKLDCDSALGLSFKMSASEGAILTIPEGATSADLEDLARIRKYAAANLLRWYRYVNGPRGRDARNGEIRIVIGCDKSASWGTATMTNDTPESNCQLKFRPLRRESGTDTAITAYTWEHSGRGETRVGPDVQEIEELRSGDPLAYPNCKYQNQCLFLRTMNPILGDEEWLNLCYELDTPHLIEPRHTTSGHDHQNARRGGKSTSSNSASGAGRSHPYRRSGGTREYALFGGPPESGHPPTLSVSTTASPEATPFHPSEAINRALLKKVPNARIIITEDSNWSSILNEMDCGIPCNEELSERVLNSHHIEDDDGVIFLRRKAIHQTNSSSNVSAKDHAKHDNHPRKGIGLNEHAPVTNSSASTSEDVDHDWNFNMYPHGSIRRFIEGQNSGSLDSGPRSEIHDVVMIGMAKWLVINPEPWSVQSLIKIGLSPLVPTAILAIVTHSVAICPTDTPQRRLPTPPSQSSGVHETRSGVKRPTEDAEATTRAMKRRC